MANVGSGKVPHLALTHCRKQHASPYLDPPARAVAAGQIPLPKYFFLRGPCHYQHFIVPFHLDTTDILCFLHLSILAALLVVCKHSFICSASHKKACCRLKSQGRRYLCHKNRLCLVMATSYNAFYLCVSNISLIWATQLSQFAELCFFLTRCGYIWLWYNDVI